MAGESVYFYGNPFEETVDQAKNIILDAGIEYIDVGTEGGPNVLWGGEKFGANSPKSIEDFVGVYLKEKKELEEAEKRWLEEAKTTPEEREARRKNAQAYLEELHFQLERILDLKKDYLSYAGKNRMQFLAEYIDPLTRAINESRELPDFSKTKASGRMPLLIVLPFSVVPFEAQVARVAQDFPYELTKVGHRFVEDILPRFMGEKRSPGLYSNSDHLRPYLLFDVDCGREAQGVAPRMAAEWLGGKKRIPLTLEESIALVTHGETEKMCQVWVCGHAATWTDGRMMTPYWYFDPNNDPTLAVVYYDDDAIPLGWRESGAGSYLMAIGKDFVVPNIVGIDGV